MTSGGSALQTKYDLEEKNNASGGVQMKCCLTCFNKFDPPEEKGICDWQELYCSWGCYTKSIPFERAQAAWERLEEELPLRYCGDIRTVLRQDEFTARFRGWVEGVGRDVGSSPRRIPTTTLLRMIDAQAQLIDALGQRVSLLEELCKDHPNE
jgi:hypothetical protein